MKLVDYRIAQHEIPLPPIEAPLFEYVMAGNGISIRGARREFQTQFCIAPCLVRGLEELEPSLSLHASRVPSEIVQEMLDRARGAHDEEGQPCEIVFHLELDDSGVWQCHVPDQTQAPARAKPTNDSPTSSYARACIEVHSHVDMDAWFSSLDDRDEVGVRIYAVLGRVTAMPEIRVRVGIYGYRQEIPASWVFDLPPNITDTVTGEDLALQSVR
jgi:hypothetical protein